jgi:uncharacterized protein (DUF952 family)
MDDRRSTSKSGTEDRTVLYHVTERSIWAASQRAGAHRSSTRGRGLDDVGFVHCSYRHQLAGVIERFYADVDPAEMVVLVIDETRLGVEVRVEPAAPGAEAFPHIYGPIPPGAVTDVLPLVIGADGHRTPFASTP